MCGVDHLVYLHSPCQNSEISVKFCDTCVFESRRPSQSGVYREPAFTLEGNWNEPKYTSDLVKYLKNCPKWSGEHKIESQDLWCPGGRGCDRSAWVEEWSLGRQYDKVDKFLKSIPRRGLLIELFELASGIKRHEDQLAKEASDAQKGKAWHIAKEVKAHAKRFFPRKSVSMFK